MLILNSCCTYTLVEYIFCISHNVVFFSDDSFTESESKSPMFALSAEQLLNRTELTEKIVTESLLGRTSMKDKVGSPAIFSPVTLLIFNLGLL